MNGLQINLNPVKKRSCEKISTRQSESFPLIQNFLHLWKLKDMRIKNAEFGENSRKYITFRSPDMSRPVRGSAKSLGKNFTKERIKERINNKLHRTTVPSVRNKLIDTNTPNIAGNIGLQKWANKENLKLSLLNITRCFTHNLHNFSELEDRIAIVTYAAKRGKYLCCFSRVSDTSSSRNAEICRTISEK